MIEMFITLVVVGAVAGIIFSVRWLLMKLPVDPDPWDGQIDKQELDESSASVCLNCSKPVENFSQHYCPNCGGITGEYTRYIPFVNIQFNYSIFGTLWSKLKNRKTVLPAWIIYLVLIIFLAPAILMVGVPLSVYSMIKRFKQKKSADPKL